MVFIKKSGITLNLKFFAEIPNLVVLGLQLARIDMGNLTISLRIAMILRAMPAFGGWRL